MKELMDLYLDQLDVIYNLITVIGLEYLQYLLGLIIILSILRAIYKYAAGDVIGKPTYSSWILRFGDWIMVKIGWSNKSEFLIEKFQGEKDNPNKQVPVGFNLLGILFDAGGTGIILGISLLIWPIVLFLAVTIGPLQWCRNRSIRKKVFMAKLKGEEVDA